MSERPASLGTLGRRGHSDLNFVPDDADRKRVDFYSSVVAPGPIADIESPGMERASHDVLIKVPIGQRCAHVRALIVDCVESAMVVEDRDAPFRELEGPALAQGYLVRLGHAAKLVIQAMAPSRGR